LSVAGVEDMTLEKIPKWESELWSLISRGDGEHCPSYDHCRNRLGGGWCPSDNLGDITHFLDDKKFDISKCGSIMQSTGGRECGRIFKLVERLGEKYLQRVEVNYIPVPTRIFSLTDEQYPIEVRSVALKCCHGAIWHIRDGWVIQLRENDTSAKKRLTLFHEVFHILAHRKAIIVFRKRGCEVGSFNELLADYFAACVLMPRKWIKEKWSKVKDLNQLAKIFNVPKPLMWFRLREIGLV